MSRSPGVSPVMNLKGLNDDPVLNYKINTDRLVDQRKTTKDIGRP